MPPPRSALRALKLIAAPKAPPRVDHVVPSDRGDKSLEQAARRIGRRPLAHTAERPGGETVDLQTSAGARKTDDGGSLRAAATKGYLECTAPGRERRPDVKARTIAIVLAHNAGHLLAFAGKQRAGPAAPKAPDIVHSAKDSPTPSCGILPAKIDGLIEAHKAQMLSCSWREMRIPTLGGARLSGYETGANPDFQRLDRHGFTDSASARPPALGMTPSTNREASMQFCTSHELREQMSSIRRDIVPLCG